MGYIDVPDEVRDTERLSDGDGSLETPPEFGGLSTMFKLVWE